MINVLLWTVESDYDASAVKNFTDSMIGDLAPNLRITVQGKQAYQRVAGHDMGLERAVINELRIFNRVIFIYDRDSLTELQERKQQSRSFVSKIERLKENPEFSDRVFIHMAIEELEAWLLTDCLGIACYFLRGTYKKDARKTITANRKLAKAVKKHQMANTELVHDPKEYLVSFSQDLLKIAKPDIQKRDLSTRQYSERQSPRVAEYLILSNEALQRNRSLQKLGDRLRRDD